MKWHASDYQNCRKPYLHGSDAAEDSSSDSMFIEEVWRLFRAGGPVLHFRPAAIIFCFVFQRNLACQFFKNFCIVLQKPEIDAEYDCKYSEFDEYNAAPAVNELGL